jgi:hypothetical protein
MNHIRKRKATSQWTDRIGSLADRGDRSEESLDIDQELYNRSTRTNANSVPIALRLEGPYFTPAKPSGYKTVVCLVAGTGVSGALAITGAFKELSRQSVFSESTLEFSSAVTPQDIPSRNSSIKTARRGSQRDYLWTRCVVIWSVREDAFIKLPELDSKFCVISHATNSILC